MGDTIKDLCKVNWSLMAAWVGIDWTPADVDHAMKALLSTVAIILSILTFLDNRRKRKDQHGKDTEIPGEPRG